ncbi:MAG: indolepyruvate oxidoreductase subunit beta family protein [Steroidobacteraceae bacterium]
MAERPIKLSIAALGGQGGGVLAQWLVEIAKSEGYIAQSTSVPGVAQRTGATVYYLEFFPRAAAARAGREPVMALMPVPGDVDCVIASELAEAGRAIQRGLVTPERTLLIASTHRSYAIGEKSALGSGATDSGELAQLIRSSARRVILFDMEETAERNHSVISSVLLGALCGSGALPFRKQAFEAAIRSSGIAVEANLAAFEDANQRAQRADSGFTGKPARTPPQDIPSTARAHRAQALLDRVRRLPPPVQPVALEGTRRVTDYQDPRYALLYLDRLERVAALESRAGAGADGNSYALLESTARSLALWMSFEDPMRVADLKTRGSRFVRVREEIRAPAGQLFGITDFMKPRVQEIAGTMPAPVGRWVLHSARLSKWLARGTGGRRIRTSTISGFLLLYAVAGLKRWRRSTLRFHEENARIEDWLGRIEGLAAENYSLAVELARAQRLIKGYGETHERGWRNFSLLLGQLGTLAPRSDGGALLARLIDAALADEEGAALRHELAALEGR